jgi:glycosyltransferase involved in cell wall biosynthesis
MTITIITVCYNSAAVIRTALESVLRQTLTDLEYLVIDGGSMDGTVEILREYEPKFGGRMRWFSERDRGMYDAINKGIVRAAGDVVGILNADDVLADDRVIERVAERFGYSRPSQLAVGEEACRRGQGDAAGANMVVLDAGFHVDAVYGDIRFVADRRDVALDELRSEPTVRYYSARHWRPWMLQWGFMPPHPSVYIRRECFERLGTYSLDYKIAADYALLIRFLRKGKLRSRYLPMCFVDMRVGGVSTKNWRSNLLLNQEIVRGNREAGYFCCLPMLVPKYAFKVWEFAGPMVKRCLVRNPQSATTRRLSQRRREHGEKQN